MIKEESLKDEQGLQSYFIAEIVQTIIIYLSSCFGFGIPTFRSYRELIPIGVDRVLTSGQETSAIKGICLLKNIDNIAINAENALVFKENGFKEIHFSTTSLKQVVPNPKVSMNSTKFLDDTLVAISDYDKIVKIRAVLE